MNDTPKTDERTYPADCLGKTPVVNADWAKVLERENIALRAALDLLRNNIAEAVRQDCRTLHRFEEVCVALKKAKP